MMLGGLIGTIDVSGTFSQFEIKLLEAAEIFHIGKNSSFGLGKIKIKKRLEEQEWNKKSY